MSKRKNRPGHGSQLRPINNYRAERYIMHIMNVEIGILQASTADPELTDSEVKATLKGLITELRVSKSISEITPSNLTAKLIMEGLKQAFNKHGVLTKEDIIGIFDVIIHSITAHSETRGRGYLNYLKKFLEKIGVKVRKVSKEEAKELGLTE